MMWKPTSKTLVVSHDFNAGCKDSHTACLIYVLSVVHVLDYVTFGEGWKRELLLKEVMILMTICDWEDSGYGSTSPNSMGSIKDLDLSHSSHPGTIKGGLQRRGPGMSRVG